MNYRRIFSSTLSISGRLMSNFYPICERFASSAKTIGFARGIKSTSFFILNKNHGNTIVSAHGTGYEYIPNPYDGQAHPTRTRAMIYSNSCLCAMNSTGTTQACFTINNSSGTVSITSLRMGCIPSESFHVSNPRGNKRTSVLRSMEVRRSTRKYGEVRRSRRSTKKYQEVSRSIEKYQEVPRSPRKY